MKKITLFAGCCSLIMTVFTAKSQIISTVAGISHQGYTGDGGPATAAEFGNPNCVTFDATGNYYVSDETNNVVRMVNTAGIVTTIAGKAGPGNFSGDGGQATVAGLSWPIGIAIDGTGNIYIGDFVNAAIRKINKSTGIITTVAGIGTYGGYSGDGGQATAAELNSPRYIAFDKSNNLFIGDASNYCIRRVDASTGIITTVAGIGGHTGFSGDGGQATAAEMGYTYGVALDDSNNIYISDQSNNRIREVRIMTGIITTVAGNGAAGYYGDGGPATAAELDIPDAISVAYNGDIFISGTGEQTIRKVLRSNGIISTFAGNNVKGFSGDGGPATAAELYYPAGITIDYYGNLYIPDWENYRVRKITLAEDETGIANLQSNNDKGINVFPNPANKQLSVSFNGINGKVSVTMYNLLGQEMLTKSTNTNQPVMINTSNLTKGIYLLKVQPEDGRSYVRKVEIERE